jgi:cytochrome P450
MTQMTADNLLQQATDYANRADPYPIWAELRKTPVARQADGSWTVSRYWDIVSLLHDPRLSSDSRNIDPRQGGTPLPPEDPRFPPAFIRLDPPEHDRLRRQAMRPFGPPHSPRRIHGMRGELTRIVDELIDGFAGHDQVDLVDGCSYPFPVTVICRLLGVPRADEPRFRGWADALVSGLDSGGSEEDVKARLRAVEEARTELGQYFVELVKERTVSPGEDMLSELLHDDGLTGRMSMGEVVSTAILLLIAGHETTVNLIGNGLLLLLRRPDLLDRLRAEPDLAVPLVEELLRYEPPVQMLPQRTVLSDLDIRGTTIPKGAPIRLVLAAGNRDPERFDDPDRFDPGRADNQHLSFGSGIHNCYGAPLARLEAQIALTRLAQRLSNPRLLEDPPPYRSSAVLRGPRHLRVALDGLLR